METINCIVCGESKSTPYIEISDRLFQNLELSVFGKINEKSMKINENQ